MDHYERQYDVQTLALLCCAFGARDGPPPINSGPSKAERNVDFGNVSNTPVLRRVGTVREFVLQIENDISVASVHTRFFLPTRLEFRPRASISDFC